MNPINTPQPHEWKITKFEGISASKIGKQLFGEEAKPEKPTTIAGKLVQAVEKLGRSALAVIYRIQSVVNGGEWLTKESVMKKLTSDIALLSNMIQGTPKIADGYHLYTFAINEMRAVCDAFRDHGIDNEKIQTLETGLENLEVGLNKLMLSQDKAKKVGRKQNEVANVLVALTKSSLKKTSGGVKKTSEVEKSIPVAHADLVNAAKNLIKIARAVKTPDGDEYLHYSLGQILEGWSGDNRALGNLENTLKKPKFSEDELSNTVLAIIGLVKKGFGQEVHVTKGPNGQPGLWGGNIEKFPDVKQALKLLKEQLDKSFPDEL